MLNERAFLWGGHLFRLQVFLPNRSIVPYVNGFRDMSLYEVCYYVCLEWANTRGWIIITNRVPHTRRPISWKVNPKIGDPDFLLLQSLFPSFFWEDASVNVWCTRLCTSCCVDDKTNPKTLNPWSTGLRPGHIYQDFRYRAGITHYTDCLNELTSYSTRNQDKTSS